MQYNSVHTKIAIKSAMAPLLLSSRSPGDMVEDQEDLVLEEEAAGQRIRQRLIEGLKKNGASDSVALSGEESNSIKIPPFVGLNDLTIEKCVGSGAFSSVYRVRLNHHRHHHSTSSGTDATSTSCANTCSSSSRGLARKSSLLDNGTITSGQNSNRGMSQHRKASLGSFCSESSATSALSREDEEEEAETGSIHEDDEDITFDEGEEEEFESINAASEVPKWRYRRSSTISNADMQSPSYSHRHQRDEEASSFEEVEAQDHAPPERQLPCPSRGNHVCPGSHEYYALKRLSKKTLSCPETVAMAEKDLAIEAAILLKLPEHPNIITLYGVSEGFLDDPSRSCASKPFILLEELSENLSRRLDRWRNAKSAQVSVPAWSIPILGSSFYKDRYADEQFDRIRTIGLPVAKAMAFLHSHKICYRDLKPGNVGFAANSGQVRLFDFGLAREHHGNEDEKRLTGFTGTSR